MATNETIPPGEDERSPFEDETEDEAQRSAERRDSFDEPTEREVRIPPGEVVPPGEIVPDAVEKIAGADAGEERREGGAGDSDIERGTR